jgi:hypothetical protein
MMNAKEIPWLIVAMVLAMLYGGAWCDLQHRQPDWLDERCREHLEDTMDEQNKPMGDWNTPRRWYG